MPRIHFDPTAAHVGISQPDQPVDPATGLRFLLIVDGADEYVLPLGANVIAALHKQTSPVTIVAGSGKVQAPRLDIPREL